MNKKVPEITENVEELKSPFTQLQTSASNPETLGTVSFTKRTREASNASRRVARCAPRHCRALA